MGGSIRYFIIISLLLNISCQHTEKSRKLASKKNLQVCQDLEGLESVLINASNSDPSFKEKINAAIKLKNKVVDQVYEETKNYAGNDLVYKLSYKSFARRADFHSNIFLINLEQIIKDPLDNLYKMFSLHDAYFHYINECTYSEACDSSFLKEAEHYQKIKILNDGKTVLVPHPTTGSRLEHKISRISFNQATPLLEWLLKQNFGSLTYSQLALESLKIYNNDLTKALGAIGFLFDEEQKITDDARKKASILGYKMKPLFCNDSTDHIGYNFHFWAYLNIGLTGGGWKEKAFNYTFQKKIEKDDGDYYANKLGLNIGINIMNALSN